MKMYSFSFVNLFIVNYYVNEFCYGIFYKKKFKICCLLKYTQIILPEDYIE